MKLQSKTSNWYKFHTDPSVGGLPKVTYALYACLKPLITSPFLTRFP